MESCSKKIGQVRRTLFGTNLADLPRYGQDDDYSATIERVIRRRNVNLPVVLRDIKNGDLDMEFGNAEIFSDKLELRITLDQEDTIRQLQAPIYVGCGHHMQTRLGAHDPLTNMSQSAKSWFLFLSILTAMGILFETVRLPIIKIWEQGQLKMAEILVTMLSGSLLVDGGLNQSQPGNTTMKGNNDAVYQEAIKQLFIRTKWTAFNIQESRDQLRLRTQALQTFKQFKDGDPVGEAITKSRESIDQIKKDAQQLRFSVTKEESAWL